MKRNFKLTKNAKKCDKNSEKSSKSKHEVHQKQRVVFMCVKTTQCREIMKLVINNMEQKKRFSSKAEVAL